MKLLERRFGLRGHAASLAAVLVLAAPSSLAAQGTSGLGIGLEVDGGYRVLAGDELDGLEDGWVAHALGSYAWRSGWEAGVGVGISFHDPVATNRDGDITELLGVLRYRFGVPGGTFQHLHPFLEGRAGLTRFSTSSPGNDDISQDGATLGGQGGVEYWMSDEVGLVAAVGLDYLDLSAGDGLPERSGWSFRPHVGLKLRY